MEKDKMKQPEIKLGKNHGIWQNYQLKDFAQKVIRKNNNMELSVVLTNSAEYGVIGQRDFFEHDIAKASNLAGYYVVSPDDFVYNPRVSVTAPVGPINRNMLGYAGVMSPLYFVFKVNGLNKAFLSYYFKTDKWHMFMRNSGNCGARFDRLSIPDNVFTKMPICAPIDHQEQIQVASYFTSLDSQIQATSKKIESLKQIKVASLQSMFPQEGETKPRVRFKGFEEEWKFSFAAKIFKTFDERNRSDLPILSACQDIRGMALRDSVKYDISYNKSSTVTYKRVKPSQFVIHLRSFQGGFAHSSVDGISSPAYTVFEFQKYNLHDDYFWKYIFMSKTFIERLKKITYGIRDGRSISFKEFSEMEFFFPKFEEQQKIASFFRSIDQKIALESERLEKLKQIKAACLDKMFV